MLIGKLGNYTATCTEEVEPTEWIVKYYSSTWNKVKVALFRNENNAIEYFEEKKQAKRKQLTLTKRVATVVETVYK